MFTETPDARSIEANFRAAIDYIMKNITHGTKCSKKLQLLLHPCWVRSAAGSGLSAVGVPTGIKRKTPTKWSNHHAAFLRHVNILFNETLAPYRSTFPTWLTPQFITQANLKGGQCRKELWLKEKAANEDDANEDRIEGDPDERDNADANVNADDNANEDKAIVNGT